MDGPADTRNLTCPKCGAASVTLPRFARRRRNPIVCSSCGVRLQRVLPAVPYYTLEFFIGLLVEPTAFTLLILMFLQKWVWVAGILIGFVGLNLGVSVFLNSRTRVEFAKIEDARQDNPGRWYPQ